MADLRSGSTVGGKFIETQETSAARISDAISKLRFYGAQINDSTIADSTVYSSLKVQQLISTVAPVTSVYTKGESDQLLATKLNILDSYTKIQIDNLLANKSDSANVYTKASIDSFLGTKADTSVVNAKADAASVYTKTQADSLLANKANDADVVHINGGVMTGDLETTALIIKSPDNSRWKITIDNSGAIIVVKL